jgi:hypothetical protein
MEATVMKQRPSSRRRRNSTKSILRLPDLEHAKAALLNSLTSPDALIHVEQGLVNLHSS